MKRLFIRTLLALYPAAWRREYGLELAEILNAGPLTARSAADVLWNGMRQRVVAPEPWALAAAVSLLIALMPWAPHSTGRFYLDLALAFVLGFWTRCRGGSPALSYLKVAAALVSIGLMFSLATRRSAFSTWPSVLSLIALRVAAASLGGLAARAAGRLRGGRAA
jgi:hypothetical protein